MAATLTVCKVDLADLVFSESSQSGSKQIFTNPSAGLQAGESIEIDHALRAVGAKGTDRHTVTYRLGDVDAVTGQYTQLSLSLTLNIPRATGITAAKVKDAAKIMQCFLKQSVVGDLMNAVNPSGDISVTSFVPN